MDDENLRPNGENANENRQRNYYAMEKLPPEEIRLIIRHFEPEEEFSGDVVHQMFQAKRDDEQGINMSSKLEGEEITNSLDR